MEFSSETDWRKMGHFNDSDFEDEDFLSEFGIKNQKDSSQMQ